MASAVLDSSCVLALLNDEPGAAAVSAVLADALISIVNYAEVVSKLVERGATLEGARSALRAIGITIAAFDERLADRTGELRAATKRAGLSLGDRACIALAERERVPAFTCDRSWAVVDCGVKIQVVR